MHMPSSVLYCTFLLVVFVSLHHLSLAREVRGQRLPRPENASLSKKKHRLYHCPEWYEVRREVPEAFRAKGENFKERVEVAKGYGHAQSQ